MGFNKSSFFKDKQKIMNGINKFKQIYPLTNSSFKRHSEMTTNIRIGLVYFHSKENYKDEQIIIDDSTTFTNFWVEPPSAQF